MGQNFVIDAAQIRQIKSVLNGDPHEFGAASRAITIEKDTPVQIGEPASSPAIEALKSKLKKHFKTARNIRRAWLLFMQVPETEAVSFLLICDFSGDRKETFDGIYVAVRNLLPAETPLDMIPFDSEFGESATGGRTPFYKKGLLG